MNKDVSQYSLSQERERVSESKKKIEIIIKKIKTQCRQQGLCLKFFGQLKDRRLFNLLSEEKIYWLNGLKELK